MLKRSLGSSVHVDPFPPSWLVFSRALVWHLHFSFIPGGPSLVVLCHGLVKVLSETCGYETLSYKYNCRVINSMYINYLLNVDIQLRWGKSQKHVMLNWEYFFLLLENWKLCYNIRPSQVHICVMWEKGEEQTASSFCSYKVAPKTHSKSHWQKSSEKWGIDQFYYSLFTEISA